MEIIKTYVTVVENSKRVELKFINKVPTENEIQAAYEKATTPVSELNGCPMNNPKCPLYRENK